MLELSIVAADPTRLPTGKVATLYGVQVKTTMTEFGGSGRLPLRQYQVQRRYTDFKEFYKQLARPAAQAGVVLPALPPGGVGTFFSKNSERTILKRKHAFEALLQRVAGSQQLRTHPLFAAFLEEGRPHHG